MAFISLAALVAIIILSAFTKMNPGLCALGLAWVLGAFGANMGVSEIVSGFPTHLFLMLVGVTYLFGLAKHNGTLDKLTRMAIDSLHHKPILMPVGFFLLSLILSTIGAGNIGTVALLAPIAMAVAWETGIGAFFMTIVVICGANAGAFSPFAMTGVIANGLISKIGLTMDPWVHVFWPNFLAQTVLMMACLLIFYPRLKKHHEHAKALESLQKSSATPWSLAQAFTIVAIAVLLLSNIFLKADIGFMSLLLGSALALLNFSESKEAIKIVPWNTILMVCGVNTLVGILETMGGMGLLTDVMAKVSNPNNVTAVTAFTTGIISAFSSSSGVVLPTFIPLVPDLVGKIGGGDIVSVIASVNVGAHLVDISPLSSLGALCLANAIHEDREKLFRELLAFGLFMAVAGALICFVLF